jgi:hypothetical protein
VGEVPEDLCKLRGGSLHFLWVDCSPMPSTNLPKVFCPIDSCCTICFEGDDNVHDGPAVDNTHVVAGDTTSDLKSMLSSRSSDEGASLADIHSPQFRAYAWLVADESYAQVYIVQRILQRYALATLYFATDGPHWLNNEKWLSLSHECDWYGVTGCPDSLLDGDGVTSIDLTGNGLKGPIPPEVLGLETLSSVLLANNALSGPIPKEIGAMSRAKIIDLGENRLTSIPPEMGNLSAAVHIFVQGNSIGSQAMPDEVCELRKVGSLTMLWADCMQCPLDCCTTCFSGWSADEENDGWGTFNNTSITLADLNGELLTSLKAYSHGKKQSLALISRFAFVIESDVRHFQS